MMEVSHQLMRQQLHTLERKAARNRNRKRAECSSSSDESWLRATQAIKDTADQAAQLHRHPHLYSPIVPVVLALVGPMELYHARRILTLYGF
jgi:hypothetical protein